MEKESKDYGRLIAAQNESARRLKIKKIIRKLSDENKKRSESAIVFGISLCGLTVATLTGVNIEQAIQTEIQALSSFDALREYLGLFTPAMWATIILGASSMCDYMRHDRAYKKANNEFYDMMDTQPEDYQEIVEHQAKSR